MQVAFFDFDQTLIRENSLDRLFRAASNKDALWPMVLPLLLKSAFWQQPKAAIKEHLYRVCLNGTTDELLYDIGSRCSEYFTPNKTVVDALHDHHFAGGEVWIVTASPAPYVRGLVDSLGWPCQVLLGTELVSKNNILTGKFERECAFEEKVRRINQLIEAEQRHLNMALAYGNTPADGPMLSMVQRGFVVKDGKVSRFN